MTDAIIIEETSNWIKQVVIGCNFCPFAAKALQQKSIYYFVVKETNVKSSLETLVKQLHYLDEAETVETSFIIFPNHYKDFYTYLDLVDKAERLLLKEGYEGIYQLASFHPEYCFGGTDENDAANFTNRSLYPMLHILREDGITKALENFSNPENIPERNIGFARQKGLNYMQLLRFSCFK